MSAWRDLRLVISRFCPDDPMPQLVDADFTRPWLRPVTEAEAWVRRKAHALCKGSRADNYALRECLLLFRPYDEGSLVLACAWNLVDVARRKQDLEALTHLNSVLHSLK